MEPSPSSEIEWEFAPHVEPVFDPYRNKVLYGGRGGVKSWTAARALLIEGFSKTLRVLCTREVQKSIKDSVHTLLKDQIELLGLGSFYTVLQNEIRGRNGTTFVFTGLSNLTADSIKSYEGVDRVWVEEAATVTKRSWDILIPTIRKDGSEIWVTFNPDLDTDDTWVRFVENTPPDTLLLECSYHNNPWFPNVLEDERQTFLRAVESGARTQAEYDNIWEGKCKPSVDGAIYPHEIAKVIEDGRLLDVPYDPKYKVHTVWDLGWNDKMAIIFVQVTPGSVRVIDYIEDSHRTYDSYAQQIKDKQYNLANPSCWFPHDGKARNPQTGVSPIEYMQSLGLKVSEIPDIGIKPGIEAARQMFSRVYFDKQRCTPLFNRLRRYARVISPTTDTPMLPKKDENTHGADAFRYLAVVESKLSNESMNFKPLNYDNAGIV